ncbi:MULTISPECIES: glycosyltransferase [Paenibacillus]|uniref:glycosyltransferase n=1 Tax=Paenibacillus TaxID=44249 RepID=UPI0022B93E78|nr:glycosyltransferase [Paenibacillus caseinilyticus]MCZ8523109.1 glycosyltransferase [Paenibacillus caseinilyticus]
MRKTILFVLPNLQGGGAEKVTLSFIKYLDKDKYKPILFLLKNEGVYWNDVSSDVEVHYALESGQSLMKNGFSVLKKLISVSKRCDILIGCLELITTYLVVISGKLLKKPTIGWVHTNLKYYPTATKWSYKFFTKLFYGLLDKTICVSEGVLRDFIKEYPSIHETKVVRLYNILEPVVIDHPENEPSDEQKDIPTVIAMGRLVKEKGFDTLIKAHSELIAEKTAHSLLILGEGEQRESLEELIRELRVDKTVTLQGFVPNPNEYLLEADIFVLSSRFEGFGMVILEAMAAGVPVVATNCDGPIEILENGTHGKLVPIDDINALKQAIKTLLNSDKVRGAFISSGLERVKDFYPSKVMPQFEMIIREVQDEN